MAEKVYDLKALTDRFNELGYPYTFRQVQRMASTRKIPVFKGPNNRDLFIKEKDFERYMERFTSPTQETHRGTPAP